MRIADPVVLRANDLAVCRALLRRGSRSFHAASLLLPRTARAAIAPVYAFCRLADDAVDLAPDPANGLREMRRRLDRVYATGEARGPVERALHAVVHRFALPRPVFDALLEGFSWELQDRSYETLSDVRSYAVRVAGTVGVLVSLLLGRRDRYTLARAVDLGVAMQLTNIARDVGEDMRRGRLYIPRAWLRESGVEPERFLSTPRHTSVASRLVARLLREADRLYVRAEPGIARLPVAARPAMWAARKIYADVGRVIARRGYDTTERRAFTSTPRKVWLGVTALTAPLARARAEPTPSAPLPEAVPLLQTVAARPVSSLRPAVTARLSMDLPS